MSRQFSITQRLNELGMDVTQLATAAGLDQRTADAIVAGRYTTSPSQRERIAAALQLSPDQIVWGRAVEVHHLYGHGPQFGRSP
jgi:hypothetical protein